MALVTRNKDAIGCIRLEWITHQININKVAPPSGLEAKFSYGAAIALSPRGYYTGALESFADGVSTRPELSALAELVGLTRAVARA